MASLALSVLGCTIGIRCDDARVRALLACEYGPMRRDADAAVPQYRVAAGPGRGFVIENCQRSWRASNEAELLLVLDKEIIIDLQKKRRDLYFLHSAVLEFRGQAVLLVAPSGTGKSTTAWALSHHGFRYLSDELAPVDLKSFTVHPFLRALCLKAYPPATYPLPKSTVRTTRTLHVPAEDLPGGICTEPVPLGALFFLENRPGHRGPKIRPVSPGEAGARLLTNALNPLAHAGDGLDAAIEIAVRTALYTLIAGDLGSTCRLLRSFLEGLWPDPRRLVR